MQPDDLLSQIRQAEESIQLRLEQAGREAEELVTSCQAELERTRQDLTSHLASQAAVRRRSILNQATREVEEVLQAADQLAGSSLAQGRARLQLAVELVVRAVLPP